MKKLVGIFLLTLALFLTLTACGHEHVFGEWTTVTEATCTAEGLKERVCECGEKETDVIAILEHSFTEKVIAKSTCTKDGKIEKTCSSCGKTEEKVIKASGHSFKEATVFVPKTCTKCNKTEGKALSKAIKVGSEVKQEKHSFIVEKAFFTGSLSEKRGYVTYNHNSKYCYVIKLKFTNLDTEDFEKWSSTRISDVSMQYQGKYNYEGEYWCPVDDIVPLSTDCVYIVFEVPESMSKDTESAIYTTFTIDGTAYSLIAQKGKLASEKSDEKTSSKKDSNSSPTIKVGDERTDDKNFSFVFKELSFTSKISEKHGNVTYNYNSDGYYLAFKLDFKNLYSEAFEKSYSNRISDVKLNFDGQYDYEGEYWCPADDIVPLGNGNVYIIYKVPESVENSTAPLTATFKIDGVEFNVNCRTAK